ncbi:hypothetical protein CO652_09325 [Rhizobium sp. H4]|nr:hypothetical protein CO652_09325 [Rhizobium sp. H4]
MPWRAAGVKGFAGACRETLPCRLPLTLALSPRAGRGDVPRERSVGMRAPRLVPFAPQAGRRCRQADEGGTARPIPHPASTDIPRSRDP